MLTTHSSPEEIVVCETLPLLGDLSGFAERDCIEVAEDAKADFAREKREWIYANDLGQGFG